MKKIIAVVSRGKNSGVVLTPHRYKEGHFLVSKGGNTLDCAKKVAHENELEAWIQQGYGVRMSGPGVAPSIFTSKSLRSAAPTISPREPVEPQEVAYRTSATRTPQGAPMDEIQGLVIDTPHIDNILSGKKTWEMRSTTTHKRGIVALIRKGSGKVIGVARLVDCLGPYSSGEMLANKEHHMISTQRLADPGVAKWNWAWVMKDAQLFSVPVPYRHPNGAVIWVNLDEETQKAIRETLV